MISIAVVPSSMITSSLIKMGLMIADEIDDDLVDESANESADELWGGYHRSEAQRLREQHGNNLYDLKCKFDIDGVASNLAVKSFYDFPCHQKESSSSCFKKIKKSQGCPTE